MKFETSKPEAVEAGSASSGATARFTLEQGALAGQTFSATLDVCPSPTCGCGAVGFKCWPVSEAGATGTAASDAPAPLRFFVDVLKRAVAREVKPPAEAALRLGRAVGAELAAPHWEWLRQLFLITKRRLMENMNLDELDVDFPDTVVAGSGAMVAYQEIFPWAELFRFTLADRAWVTDDLYCVEPGCGCTETILVFSRAPNDPDLPLEPSRANPALRYDYVSDKIEVLKARSGWPAPGDFMGALRQAHPDLAEALRKRHRQMQHLGKLHLTKAREPSQHPFADVVDDGSGADAALQPPPAPVTRGPKIGHNDPCPCGSGLKYKRCCGA